MLVQPSLRWEGQTAVEPRYVTIIVFAIIRVAWLFCGWQFWMLSVFTSLFDTEHTHGTEKWWHLKGISFSRGHFQVTCKLVALVVRGEISYPIRFCSLKVGPWCFMHRSSQRFFWRRVMTKTLQSNVLTVMPSRKMSFLQVSWGKKFPHSQFSLYSYGIHMIDSHNNILNFWPADSECGKIFFSILQWFFGDWRLHFF